MCVALLYSMYAPSVQCVCLPISVAVYRDCHGFAHGADYLLWAGRHSTLTTTPRAGGKLA